ncbi:MAG: hypothetical protein K2K96_02935 [Lachnospiraceae bacterium]|nr:hypothetical protein [Lachnospiraceae bacterium]
MEMKKRIIHHIKVIFLILFAATIIFLVALYFKYLCGYRYYAVYEVGSISLNYEFDSTERWHDIRNVARNSVLQYLERYYEDIQDEEEYQKLYQAVENKDERTLFVISHGAPIRYFKYYCGDDLYCIPVRGND